MSSNHYGHIPPPPANLHPISGNRPNTDFKSLPWSVNHSNEFENREKYMETELTEVYNNCDNSANQNEVADDEPYPPPGLRRLVTGQTVSFDEGPNSPPFDRVVPGEGSAFNSYPPQSQLPLVSDPTFSNRIVSGSSTFNSSPVQSQLPPANNATVSERFVSGSASVEYNSVPPHMFASVPQTKLDQQEPTQFFNNNFCAPETHNEDFSDSYLRTKNTPDERTSHQPQVKNKPIPPFNASKSLQQQQQPYFTFSKIQPNPNVNSTFQNYQHRSQSVKQENVGQYENTFSQRTFDDFANSKSEANDSVVVNASTEAGLEDQNAIKNKEKRMQKDSLVDKKSTSRMVVEGATNASQVKMVPTSTPVHSPNYDHWYENKAPSNYEFPPAVDARNLHNNRIPDDKSQVIQPASMTPFTPVTACNTNTHSKTTSMSSNTSSVNEMSSYQQNESYANVDGTQKRKEVYDFMDSGAPKFNHTNIRSDEIGVKNKSAETQAHESRSNDKSNIVYGESDEFVNTQNRTRKENDSRSKYSSNPITGNQEPPDSSFNREPVPGAQSTPDNGQRLFSKSSVNASTAYGYQNENTLENDDDERDEAERYSDSDDKRSMNRRMVPGYNYNTIPAARKSHSKLYSDPRYEKRGHMNTKPSLETRMVLGKTSSDVSFRNSGNRVYDDQYEREDHDLDRERNRLYEEERDRRFRKDLSRNEKDRKKPNRGRPRNESDDEYTESLGHGHDVSPDRGSRSYREKHRRDSPTRYKKSSQRTDCESSVTQDDSFYEDEDDDRETYRRYDGGRRHPRSRPYMPYYADPVERDWGYCDTSYWDRHPDDVYTNRSSRPSSRTGSRDQMEFSNSARKLKLPFYNWMEKPNSHTSSSEIQYWAKMRHVDPKGYMRWFRHTYPQEYSEWYYSRYMKQKSYQDDRRGSGHSGQSSINNDSINVNEKLMGMKDMSISGDSENTSAIYEQRKSPFKFKMPHVKGLFNSLGQLVVVNESCPKEGQPADIDVYEISAPDDDPDVVEFMNFTGPFIVGETHVNTVSEFVRYHADSASTVSEKLLYLLIDLIIKLRGVTDGIAISELLMCTYRESQSLNAFPPKNEPPQTFSKSASATVALGEGEIIEKYTNLLLQGNKNAALDWAINHKLWGHAFLLASKMGNKHYSNVLVKFDASIPTSSPLKTLYQLYSNQIPQAATACADEKWGDWRPHLAMILSNPTPDNEVDRAAIVTLGDSLYSKDVFASHFCYLAAEATFDAWSKPSARLTLLSLRNGVDHFGVNTSNHAILLTQTYEFAKRLQRKEFIVSALLPYKYLLAVRLIDFGKCDVALQYLESVAAGLQNDVDDANKDLVCNVLELAERIKYSDSKPFVADRSIDPPWLTNLRELAATTGAQLKSSNELLCSSNDIPLMDPQTLQSHNQPQLPPSLPVQQKQQQQQQQQCQEQTPTGIQQPLMFPLLQQQQPPLVMTPNQAHPASLPLPLPSQDQQQTWERSSYNTANHQHSLNDYGQHQSTQPVSLNSEASFNVDEANFSQWQKGDDQPNDFFSPWDQPTQPAQISMHSTSNSFYDDGPPKPVAKTKTLSVAVRAAATTTKSAATASISTTVSKTNRAATLRKQVQASVASKQHYSIVKHYLSRRRTDEWADHRNNHLGQLMKNASFYYETRCNSKIVFNGTFPIDRPFGVRHSLGPKTGNTMRARTEEPVRAAQMPAAAEKEKDPKDRKQEKENGGWFGSTIGKLIRPKNQMKLPDDKNPSIVWDANRKLWVDKNSEGNDSLNVIQPPPRASELRPLAPHAPDQNQNATQPPYMGNMVPQAMPTKPAVGMRGDATLPNAVPPTGSNNIYKLQKGRGMKANYVNVLSQNTTSPASNMPPTANSMNDSSSVLAGSANVNYFMPSSGQ